MVLDLLGQYFHFRAEVLVSRRTGLDLDDQGLCAVMLDLRFFEELLLHMTATRRIKDFFLEKGMHRQLGADLLGKLRFLFVVRSLFI